MENEIQDLIAKFKVKGYSDEQIKAFLVQRKGFDANDVEAEFGAEKKKFRFSISFAIAFGNFTGISLRYRYKSTSRAVSFGFFFR